MNTNIPYITRDSFPELLEQLKKPYHDSYLAMYSSIYSGIVTDPVLMMVPIDDHMVHRGDGIFETFKCVDGAIYNFEEHLKRLQRSAANLDFRLPINMEQLRRTVIETTRAGGEHNSYIRLFISRGPGSFGVNPYDCPAAQLYVVITRAPQPFMTAHPKGASLGTSSIPVKHPFFAGVKNCNYLNNVLMKKEAVKAKVDFVVAFDETGRLGEGATENIGVVTSDSVLIFPSLDGILMGTTMMRIMELARNAVEDGILKKVCFGDIHMTDIENASEILIAGTTTNVTKVYSFDGSPVGSGPSPVYEYLSRLLLEDIHHNPKIRTNVFK
jgi:branched-chain amino acid aminotransferase